MIKSLFKIISFPFLLIEKVLYLIRNFFWSYPAYVVGEKSAASIAGKVYSDTMPYSHFVMASIVVLSFFFLFNNSQYKKILNAQQVRLIEAVVTGTDSEGRLQRINKVNPILPTNFQLEKDLIELIYEPLIRYDYAQKNDGTYEPTIVDVLADEVVKIKQGADYQFNLKKGIKWHDGVEFTADDVIATFNLVSNLTSSDNAYIRAIKQMRWEKISKYSLRLCTKEDLTKDISCNESQGTRVFANFLELISIKILPAHKLIDVNQTAVESGNADIFRSPIGTGKYKFFSANNQSVILTLNTNYLFFGGEQPQIQEIEFKGYKTLGDAVGAIQNGEAHSLVSASVQYRKDLEQFSNIESNLSPVLDNQYWGLYFNLKTDPSGNPKGPKFFQDVAVRQAISLAISRAEIINNALLGVGEEAFGAIPKKSEFFNKDAGFYTFDPEASRQLFDTAGWTLKKGNKYRTNDKGEEMSFSLYFVNSFDRLNIAKVIQKNLENVGVNVIIDRRLQPGQENSEDAPSGWSLGEINQQVLAPRSFDAILYGMNTFIDPDRFELFHSTQSNYPGLNISSYVGSIKSVKPREDRKEGESSTIEVPKIDKFLEQARERDPEADKENRKSEYFQIQEFIAADAPVVFLYNPQFIYYTNINLKTIDLKNVSSVEGRFLNIEKWRVG